ncbi:MAG TPA: hypothetical protein VIN07_01580, partial [Flavipsychrobacter sp.]
MKRAYLLILLIFLAFANSTGAKELDTVITKESGGWEFVQVIVIANKDVILEGSLYKGKREGVWSEYWPSKYAKSMTSYHAGKKHGLYMEIDADGALHLIEHYKNDKLHGPRREYKHLGPMLLEENYANG